MAILFSLITIFIISSPTVSSSLCPLGFDLEVNGNCYAVVEDVQMTFENAREECKAMNEKADLATFDNVDDERSVTPDNEHFNYWIGANDKNQEGVVVWLDDDVPTIYKNWADGQAEISSDMLNCVSLSGRSDGWSKMFCQTNLPFICGINAEEGDDGSETPVVAALDSSEADNDTTPVIDPATTEFPDMGNDSFLLDVATTTENEEVTIVVPECEEGWTMEEGVGCLKVFHDNKTTWAEARSRCQEMDADLIPVTDQETFALMKNFFATDEMACESRTRYWFALNKKSDDTELVWLDDYEKTSKFFRWCRQPEKHPEAPLCGLMVCWKEGRWNNVQCDDQHHFICLKNRDVYALLGVDNPTETQDEEEGTE